MKKSLIMILCLSCFISFSFAGYRTDKYEELEYNKYNTEVQNILNSEGYKSRNSTAIKEAGTTRYYNRQKGRYETYYNMSLCVNGCTTLGMTAEELEIYEKYISAKDKYDQWIAKDNECFQSMNGYYDNNTDSCVCEDGYENNNGICKIKQECSVKYGNHVKGYVDNCECVEGYSWNSDKTICVENETIKEDNEEDIILCTEQYEPICGKDGKLYSNKCFMEVAGVEEDIELSIINGKCEKNTVPEPEESKNEEVDNRPEIEQAISWMFEKGLTAFNEPISFMAYNGLRRDEAAKFFVKYAKEVMGMVPDYSKQGCTFKDLDQAWSDLKDVIVESCQLGLFQGSKGKFMPTQKLTNAQAITVFMRLCEGYKDESGSHFANNYYESAHAQGFLYDTPLDYRENFDNYTTRGDVAKMLFRGQKNN